MKSESFLGIKKEKEAFFIETKRNANIFIRLFLLFACAVGASSLFKLSNLIISDKDIGELRYLFMFIIVILVGLFFLIIIEIKRFWNMPSGRIKFNPEDVSAIYKIKQLGRYGFAIEIRHQEKKYRIGLNEIAITQDEIDDIINGLKNFLNRQDIPVKTLGFLDQLLP